jgi:hypothetical protein
MDQYRTLIFGSNIDQTIDGFVIVDSNKQDRKNFLSESIKP